MTASIWWAVAVGFCGGALAFSLIILPEHLAKWRERLWETDSEGELPPKTNRRMPWETQE